MNLSDKSPHAGTSWSQRWGGSLACAQLATDGAARLNLASLVSDQPSTVQKKGPSWHVQPPPSTNWSGHVPLQIGLLVRTPYRNAMAQPHQHFHMPNTTEDIHTQMLQALTQLHPGCCHSVPSGTGSGT